MLALVLYSVGRQRYRAYTGYTYNVYNRNTTVCGAGYVQQNHYCYSAFGETITAEETVPNHLRYNGQMADGLTGDLQFFLKEVTLDMTIGDCMMHIEMHIKDWMILR